MKYCLCLFYFKVVRQCCGGRRRCLSNIVKKDNFRGLLGITKMDGVLNVWIRELCDIMKEVDDRRTDERS